MLTGTQRRQAYQQKHPGKTIARKSEKEQESIKRHNKMMFAQTAAEQKEIRAEKILRAKEYHEGKIADAVKFLNNKTVGSREESDKLVSQLIDY